MAYRMLWTGTGRTGIPAAVDAARCAARAADEPGFLISSESGTDEADDADMIYIVDHGQVIAKGSANRIKEQYAQNFLKVFVTDTADFKEILKEEIPFEEVRVNELLIHPETTEKTLEILTCGRSFIRQFEFRPGTMDDAFMALTGREVR